jgi:D-amino-acid dehydrogenase
MHVVVVGGGVIGLCCAAELRRAGADVTVVERGECGQRASLGNAGWVTRSLSGPRTVADALVPALRALTRRDGPVRVRAHLDRDFARWSWHFQRSMRRVRQRAGASALVALNEGTLERFDDLRSAGVEFEMESAGLIVAGLTERALDACLAGMRMLEQAGYRGDVEMLDGHALRRLEPALSDAVAAGVHIRSDRWVRPEALIQGLLRHLEEAGVDVCEATEVTGLSADGGRGWKVETSHEQLHADRILVAAGIWSKGVLSKVGFSLPLEGARGCSVTARGCGIRPRHGLELAEAMVACTPFTDGMRLAGDYEVGATDETVSATRLRTLTRSARVYLRDWRPSHSLLEWAGVRPITPDGLPFIGGVPGADGVYVATGHGMLGVTLAPSTGAAIAPLIVHGRTGPLLEPFKVDRFGRSRSKSSRSGTRRRR